MSGTCSQVWTVKVTGPLVSPGHGDVRVGVSVGVAGRSLVPEKRGDGRDSSLEDLGNR